jgi:hypothetical protein
VVARQAVAAYPLAAMRPDPAHPSSAVPAERRQAVWPWLLLPLVVLLMFVVLKTAKDSLPPNAAELPAVSAPGEAVDPR